MVQRISFESMRCTDVHKRSCNIRKESEWKEPQQVHCYSTWTKGGMNTLRLAVPDAMEAVLRAYQNIMRMT